MKTTVLILLFLSLLSCQKADKEAILKIQKINHMHNLHKTAMIYLGVSRLWLIKAENYSSITNVFFDETDSRGQIFLRYTIEALDSAKFYFELHKEYMVLYENDSINLIAENRLPDNQGIYTRKDN